MKLVSTLPLIFLFASYAWGQHGAESGHASSGASAARSFSMASPGPIRTTGSAPAYRPNWQAPQYGARYSSPIGPPPFGGTQPVPGKRYPYPTNGHRPYYHSSGVYLAPGYLGYGGFYGYSDDSSYADQSQAGPTYQDVNAQAASPDSGY